MAKLKIQVNDIQNVRDLLQTAYDLANEQVIQAQNEINKLSVATELQNESIEGRTRYAKAINDYLGIKDKAISKKLDIAKILADICNHNGDVKEALEYGTNSKGMDFNFDDIKKAIDDSYSKGEETKKIELNKK